MAIGEQSKSDESDKPDESHEPDKSDAGQRRGRPGAATERLRTRDAGVEDVPALVELINAAYVVEASLVRGLRTDAADIAGKLRAGTFLVVDDESAEPVGEREPRSGMPIAPRRLAACVYLEPRGRSGYLGLLSVQPGAQGAGLGDRLLRAGEARLRSAGCLAVEILVMSERAELFPWYEKRGFHRGGTRPFSDPAKLLRSCHFVEMRKPLVPVRSARLAPPPSDLETPPPS